MVIMISPYLPETMDMAWEMQSRRSSSVGATMGAPRRRQFILDAECLSSRRSKVDVQINESHDAFLSRLAAMTGKDPSLLVNEAVEDLIRKYRPRTEFKISRWYPAKN
jgi:hypothetical protein